MIKKIDFHIHTVASIKDSAFTFSLKWLKEYVKTTELDAIAITNHDLFDRDNFEKISYALPGIKVYPGIELTLDIGHVNIVFPHDYIDDLSKFSKYLSGIHETQGNSITCDDLRDNLHCWDKGIYIFDYGKSRSVKEIPDIFNEVVCVGGVSNQLKFNIVKKSQENITPCLFSDAHATDESSNDRNNMSKLQNKQTYLQVDSCEFENIKNCLKDKSKVSINREELKDTININDIDMSLGLNLVVGKRGTGKTHFLNEIKNCIGEDEYYEIKQFETAKADEYIEQQRKEQGLSAIRSWRIKYEKQFSKIKDYLKDSTEQDSIEDYLEGVKKFAESMAVSNSKRKYALFKDIKFEFSEVGYIEKALRDINTIIESNKIWELLPENTKKKKNDFIDVYSELRKVYIESRKDNKIKEKVNEIIKEIGSIITEKTGVKSAPECSINDIIYRQQLEKKINSFLDHVITETPIKTEDLHGYQIQVNLVPYQSASEFKKEIRTLDSVKDDLMKAYRDRDFITFLKYLKQKKFYNEANFAEYLVRKEVKLLDSDGTPASGGQAVGFALAMRLREAGQKTSYLNR